MFPSIPAWQNVFMQLQQLNTFFWCINICLAPWSAFKYLSQGPVDINAQKIMFDPYIKGLYVQQYFQERQ